MAQTNITIRMDQDDKSSFSAICEKIGMSVTTAFNIFVKAVIREEKIPFELSAKSSNLEFFEISKIIEERKSTPKDEYIPFDEAMEKAGL